MQTKAGYAYIQDVFERCQSYDSHISCLDKDITYADDTDVGPIFGLINIYSPSNIIFYGTGFDKKLNLDAFLIYQRTMEINKEIYNLSMNMYRRHLKLGYFSGT